MLRRLFTLTSVLSLILCAATAVLWILSYRRSIGIRYVHDSPGINELVQVRYVVVALRGGVTLDLTHHHAATPESVNDLLSDHHWHKTLEVSSESVKEIDAVNSKWSPYMPPQSYLILPTSPAPLGFQFATRSGIYKGNHYWAYSAAIPFWPVVVVLSVLPVLWMWRFRRLHSRAKRRLCSVCGYDLRATPNRWPECGTVPKTFKSRRETTIPLTDPSESPRV